MSMMMTALADRDLRDTAIRCVVGLVLVVVAAIFATSCRSDSAGSEHLLHLGFATLTEDTLRSRFLELDHSGDEIGLLCADLLRGEIDGVGAVQRLRTIGLGQDQATGVSANPSDISRAAEIVDEECARRRNI